MNPRSDLGYFFHPPAEDFPIGHPSLEINLLPEPTHQHFDPSEVEIQLVIDDEINPVKITHPWYGMEHAQVIAGRIIVSDRLDEKVEAFCFGGSIQILDQGAFTACFISSPAPIFELNPYDRDHCDLIDEVESILALRRGFWSAEIHEYERRLCAIDPAALYIFTLTKVASRLELIPSQARNSRYLELINCVHHHQKKIAESDFGSVIPQLLDDVL